MDILSLREFKVVAEMENVTKAAAALHIAQPALSRTIKNIEDELNIKLFDRRGRNIYLNNNGAILLKYTNDILNSIDQMKLELSEATFKSFAALPINFYAASALIPYIAKEFHNAYPNVNLQIYRQPSDQFKNGNKGRLSIYASTEEQNEDNTSLLLQERIFAVIPKSYPISKRKSIALTDIAEEKIVTCTKSVALRETLDYYYKTVGIRPNIVFECDDPSAVRNLMNSQLGISFFPEFSWGNFNFGDDVVRVPLTTKPRSQKCVRYLYLAWSGSNKEKTPIVTIFENFLHKFFDDLKSDL